jgi:hypothetical protein
MIKKFFCWSLVLILGAACQAYAQPAPLWETGQTACYDTAGNVRNCSGTGEDGEFRKGVAWPSPRFAINGDCVIDNLTGVTWAKNANLFNGTITWQGALDYVASINSGPGLCGQHDWRLPNIKELISLIDYSQYGPALPLNHPFTNVQSQAYWSSTSRLWWSTDIFVVWLWDGVVYGKFRNGGYNYFLPVRAGQ